MCPACKLLLSGCQDCTELPHHQEGRRLRCEGRSSSLSCLRPARQAGRGHGRGGTGPARLQTASLACGVASGSTSEDPCSVIVGNASCTLNCREHANRGEIGMLFRQQQCSHARGQARVPAAVSRQFPWQLAVPSRSAAHLCNFACDTHAFGRILAQGSPEGGGILLAACVGPWAGGGRGGGVFRVWGRALLQRQH